MLFFDFEKVAKQVPSAYERRVGSTCNTIL